MPPVAQRYDRQHGERTRPDESRDGFQRDRDRVLYSAGFRRLAGVTQVVHAAEGHFFHNRLTHSLKVAQFGRRLAEHLLQRQPTAHIRAVGGIDPDVVETACLAHDLGHPPFGHIAEEELHEEVRRTAGVDDGYEGNAQSFRIVTKVAIRDPDPEKPGLNLTRASLNAILKYPWAHGPGGKPLKKWGYYFSESKDFEFARGMEDDARRSVEAELMDWADDVTYAVHDVEDFYRARVVPLDQLLMPSSERSLFLASYRERYCDAKTIDEGNRRTQEAESLFEKLGQFSAALAPDIREPFSGKRVQSAQLSMLASMLITRYLGAVSLTPDSPKTRLRIQPRKRSEVDALKALMNHYVFESPALVAQQHGQRQIIRALFRTLHEAANPKSRDRGIVPEPYRGVLQKIDKENLADAEDRRERARLVSDLIASLTEQQALDFHHRLTGISPGSVLETIIR